MKTKLLLLALFILSTIITNAQPTLQWQKSLGGTDYEVATAIQQTTDGGYIVAGWSYSIDGDVTGNHGNDDYWIVKLNSTGDTLWTKSLGGKDNEVANSIQQTTDGGYIVAGWTYSIDGDVTGNHGFNDYWIVKLNSTGDILWTKSLGGNDDDRAYSIQQTTDDGYIVAGYSRSNNGDVTGNHGDYDYWVAKLNSIGDTLWTKSLGGNDFDLAYSIQQTTDDGYIVAGGSFSKNYDVSGNHGKYDFWVVKLNSTGDILWTKSLGGTDSEVASAIQQTTDGGYIVAGYSSSNNGDVSGNHGGRDYWVVKLNSTGDILWTKSLGGTDDEGASAIQQTTDGGYIVAGYSRSNNGDVTGNHGGRDYWIVNLNSTGDTLWTKSLGGTDDEVAFSIQQTTDGGYIVAGNSISNNWDVSGNHGGLDYWIVKLSPSSVGINEPFANEHSINLYPNPAGSQLAISSSSFHNEAVTVCVINAQGEIMQEQKLTWCNNINMNIKDLSEGIYFLQMKSESGSIVKKFVKE